jgi:prepilin-type N-terminal cleavage/methylation domain-containing protein
MTKLVARSQQLVAKCRHAFRISSTTYRLRATGSPGMTLVETLVAVSILSVAIVAPMALTMQSLSTAFYARDQIVASNLAQEALESVRSVRDGNILRIALNDPDPTCNPTSLLCGIPIDADFVIDTRDNQITTCEGTCPYLQTDPEQTLYGYQSGWIDTQYRRTVHVEFVDVEEDEIRVRVEVERDSGAYAPPVFVLEENMYRWVPDGTDEE